MKHFRKVSAVLLAALIVAVMLPSLGLFTTETEAAEVGMIENGDFSNGFTSWSYYEYGASIDGNSVRFSKDSSTANHITLSQVVAVNTNATYTLTFKVKGGKLNCESTPCFTYKVLGGVKGDACNVTLTSGTPSTGTSYKTNTVTVNTGSYKYIAIQFISTGTGSEDSYLDDVSLTVVNAGDTGTHAKPSFVDYGNEFNRPASASNNLIVQPSFESTTSAQWNSSDFIKSYLSVQDDAEAKDGTKSLHYKNPGTVASWHYFTVSIPTTGNYVFSAWVKTPYLSANNQGKASIGIIDPDTIAADGSGGTFFMSTLANYKGHDSTPYSQIRSTATDNEWHLRSVTIFATAGATVKIGVYGKQSEMYIDDISLHLETNGTKYVGNQTGTLTASSNSSNLYCEHEDSLIPDCNMTGATAEKFWTTNASGWNNGFMNFNGDEQRLEFNGTGVTGKKIYHYIKWIPVEPNTQYTVSYDYRITAKGSGQLRFIDNNIDLPVVFNTLSFSTATTDWKTNSFTFNSGNYNRIGVVFTDGGGTAYFDDFRIFKTADGIANEPEEEVYPTLKPDHPEKYISRMEMNAGKLGLGFLFNLEATGVTRNDTNNQFLADYTNGKVQAFENGVNYTLVSAGAVMTNDATVGQNADLFVRENVTTSETVIDITAAKLFYDPNDSQHPGYGTHIYFAMRITNIPETHKNTVIYARPYYIFEYEGRQITVYGDIEFQSYEPQKDVNDGWLEWD